MRTLQEGGTRAEAQFLTSLRDRISPCRCPGERLAATWAEDPPKSWEGAFTFRYNLSGTPRHRAVRTGTSDTGCFNYNFR